MKNYIFCCIVFCGLTDKVVAQVIENNINLYGINLPQEKIHIHFDKETYLPGETIWFKAYLLEENLPSSRSTNFYAALYDETGKLIQQKLCPIFNSTTDGHFNIPDSLQSKYLICRAYTWWMMNFDSSFLFTKTIKLINNKPSIPYQKSIHKVILQFFPEGGEVIEGERNTIAFKANYGNGLPYAINGVIKKQQTGEVVMPLKSLHDGMGKFDITIEPNEKFYAEWADEKGVLQQTYLPKGKPVGVSLKMILQKNKLVFNIINKSVSDSLHILMYMYQKVFYSTNLLVTSSDPYTGVVPINTLPDGTMQLTVFDVNWHPVAERIAFINNGNYALNTKIINKAINLQKRGKNIIELEVADTVATNMSLSITDGEINKDYYDKTITTNLLLSGDVKGYVHNPAYYFTNTIDDILKEHLDLVMLTNGWRRYNWDKMLAVTIPAIKDNPDNYLRVNGQLSKKVMNKENIDESVNLIIKTKDSTNNFYLIKPDNKGLIEQAGLIFYDSAKILFSFNKKKIWNTEMTFSTSNFTLKQPFAINNYNNYNTWDTVNILNQTASLLTYYGMVNNNTQFNKDKTLQTVIVKSSDRRNWKNDPLFKMNQRYADGLFRGPSGYDFDVMHDDMAFSKQDIYNYMVGKVPGITVNFSGGVKSFTTTDAKSAIGIVKGLILFINERRAENDEIASLNIEDIAYVKYLDTYGAELGLPHALCFYLKKGDDLIDRRPKSTDLQSVKIAGYSPIKEFYSPDYTQSNTSASVDSRITLLWLPNIITNSSNRKIPITFYNNDFSKKLRIVLEGINDEGKMVHIEKIIE